MGRKIAAWILAAALIGISGCYAGDSVSQIAADEEETVREDPGERAEETELALYLDEWKTWQKLDESLENEEAETDTVKEVPARQYAYTVLPKDEQTVYDEIYQALMNHAKKVQIDSLDAAAMDRAYKAVLADHGEIFWTSGYAYTRYIKGDVLVGLEFEPQYTMDRESRDLVQQQLTAAADEIISGITPEASEYEKAKYIYEYLITHVAYNKEAKENQNIISVLIYHETVCQGYASATQFLLSRMGIQSAIVTGTAKGEPHAWNLVNLDGAYYYMDTTWGNSAYTKAMKEIENNVYYGYLGITSAEIERTHQANDYIALPDCTALMNNYYVHEGKYISEWDEEAIGAVYRSCYKSGEKMVSLKFASRELYEQAKSYFIDNQHISEYCGGLMSIYYVEDYNLNVLTISFS